MGCTWKNKLAVPGLLLLLFWWFSHDHLLQAQVSPMPDPYGGRWQLLLENAGVSAMHMTLTYENTVVYFDKTDIGASKMVLANGRCREDSQDTVLVEDCWAHSAMYNIATNQTRALDIETDPWCSSGSFLANGTLLQTGGWNDGARAVRYLTPCPGTTASGDMMDTTSDDSTRYESCDWIETSNTLQVDRWYATNQILPDDRVIVVGGRRAYTYEFVPTRSADEGVYNLPLLEDTSEEGAENNLYPFVYLSSDDIIFIFANRDSLLLNYKTNEVLKQFPQIPGNGSRNYPSSGTSAMLPIRASDAFRKVEIMVCGGSPSGAYQQTKQRNYLPALDSCGRLVITDENPEWFMETMPSPRVMADMIILPTGDLLLINGAQSGTAGWGCARDPILSPYLYQLQPSDSSGSQWTSGRHLHPPTTDLTSKLALIDGLAPWTHIMSTKVLAETTIPRMYHSTAVLLADGRILVGGSNTNIFYNDTDVLFPTEVRMEAFSPYYLDTSLDDLRPTVTNFASHDVISYDSDFEVAFDLPNSSPPGNQSTFEVRMYTPAFSTHSFSMNQRQLVLEAQFEVEQSGLSSYRASIKSPPSPAVAPAGYYLLFVLHSGVPSVGHWLQLYGN